MLAVAPLIPVAGRTWEQFGPFAAIVQILSILALYAVVGGIAWLVETRLDGRARLWARIAQISVWLGVIVFGISFWSGGGTLLLAGAFWAFVTGAMILLAALRRDVTT